MHPVAARWGTERVAQLAPDPASVRAALGLATPVRWQTYGADERIVWGLCAGSGKSAYRTAVDLQGPAYSCSCPSRKFPCKHALALLLLWAKELVPDETALPAFAAEWLQGRATRTTPQPRERDEAAAGKRAEQRQQRVVDGLAELDRWLRDRVRTGLAHAAAEGYGPVERVAARMVDAQAPGVAGMVRRTAGVPASGEGWPARLLAEYAQLRLLTLAYGQVESLPVELAAVVRSRVGFTVAREDVLAGPAVRDRWAVLGVRDSHEGKVDTRRVWLRGARGEWAVLLLFAAGGAELSSHPDSGLLPGTAVDAELHRYPGRPALRALLGIRHGEVGPVGAPPAAGGVAELLAGYATALAEDPWLGEWPALLAGIPEADGRGGWRLRDAAGAVVPLAAGVDVWPLVATSGGRPVAVAGEWTGATLRPLTCWHRDQAVRL